MLVYIPAGVVQAQKDGKLVVTTERLSVETKLGTYQFVTGINGDLTITMRHVPADAKKPLPSSPLLLNDPEMIARQLIEDLDNGRHNGYDRISNYFVLAEEVRFSNALSVSIIEERDGLPPEEYYYSVHVIDDLTNTDAELLSTDYQTLESLTELLRSVQKETVEKYNKIHQRGQAKA